MLCKEKSHRSSFVPLAERTLYKYKMYLLQTNISSVVLLNVWPFLGDSSCDLPFSPLCWNVSATCRSRRPDCSPPFPNPTITSHNKQPRGCL